MGGSLSDQLLKAGLVSSGKAKKARHDKKRQRNQGGGEAESGAVAAERAQEKARRDRELNQQRDQERRQRAVVAEVEQLIKSNAIKLAAGDGEPELFHFTDGTTIRKIELVRQSADALASGRMAIVRAAGGYRLVRREIAERVSERLPEAVVLLNQPGAAEGDQPAADDPYADYVIPDDLRW
jgi:uncharacterized protein YaiL (DUF2058 family)